MCSKASFWLGPLCCRGTVNSVLQHGGTICDCSPCCGEEAVGYSLYHRQSASGGDVPQNLCLLTGGSWRFGALQCCFCWAVGAGGRGALNPFLVERGFCFTGAFFPCLYVIIIRIYWKKTFILRCGVVFQKKKNRSVIFFFSMSFRSLKEFGVSAERLGSICKRWMARVQRSVCVLNCFLH